MKHNNDNIIVVYGEKKVKMLCYVFRNTVTVGIFYALPALQLVLSEQKVWLATRISANLCLPHVSLSNLIPSDSFRSSFSISFTLARAHTHTHTHTCTHTHTYTHFLSLSLSLSLSVMQFLNLSGDQDECYYNFRCAHPLSFPLFGVTFHFNTFNNVWSNIGYVLLGFLFIIVALVRYAVIAIVANCK